MGITLISIKLLPRCVRPIIVGLYNRRYSRRAVIVACRQRILAANHSTSRAMLCIHRNVIAVVSAACVQAMAASESICIWQISVPTGCYRSCVSPPANTTAADIDCTLSVHGHIAPAAPKHGLIVKMLITVMVLLAVLSNLTSLCVAYNIGDFLYSVTVVNIFWRA